MEKVRVAVIGHGFLGKWHAEKAELLADSELVAIVDPRPEAQELASKKYPKAKIVSSITEVIGEIDAAIVATPTSSHYSIVKELLENSKNVFCEKPLTSSLEESHDLLELVKNKNLVLQVGHSERFHEAWEKNDLFNKYLEPPFSVRISRYAPFKGRATDVDVVQDLMIHDLDIIRMVLKKNPLSVSSIGFKSLTDKWDYAESHFDLDDQSRCTIVVGRHSVEEVRKVEFVNKYGKFQIDLLNAKLTWTEDKELKTMEYQKRDHLLIEQEEFYQSVLHNACIKVDGEEGKEAVKLVECVLKSLENGERVAIND